MNRFLVSCVLLYGIVYNVHAESTFAGSSISSDSSGTRSVLVTGRNGAGVVHSRIGPGGSGVSVGTRSGTGGVSTYAGPGGAFAGPAGAYAGPGGAFAGAGGAGAYAGAGPFGFPYWNGGGSYASASAGGSPGYYPYPYDPYAYGGGYGSGSGVGVYSDSNGIQSRFGSVGPGGQATIVEQNGNEAPRVYTYRGADSRSENSEYDN